VLPPSNNDPCTNIIEHDQPDLLPAVEITESEPPASSMPTSPTPTKSKLRRIRKRTVQLQSFTAKQAARTLLTFVGSINGHPARILIDGGAEGNVISSSFQTKHSIPSHPHQPIPIVLPDGAFSITSHAASIHLDRDNYSDDLDPLIYNLRKYDLILGKPWLTRINPLINWRTNDLHFQHNGKDVLWTCRGFTSPSITKRSQGIVMSHLHFSTLAAQEGNQVYLAMVKLDDNKKITPAPLPPEIRPLIEDEFPDIFPDSLPDGLPPDRGDAMKIETDPNADPPVRPIIRLSIAELDELKKQLDELLRKGFIKPSTSPYGAPVLFVKKKDGTLRMCVDYRGLNRITRKNRYPLPRIDELIDRLKGARYFSKLDLREGYHQQRVFEPHTHKTAFRCRYGHYEFNVVPFGLTNAPASFSAMMRTVLSDVLDKFVIAYLDDIMIYSKTKEEHLAHLRKVFSLLRKNGLYVKLSKCSFLQEQTEFLGHVISKDGIHTNAGLVRAIREWPRPSKQREVQQFIGLVQYYHQYINDFANIALPLTSLLGEGVPFSWDNDKEIAFTSLKEAVSKAPVLRIFDPDLLTGVETDASGFAIGAVLFQTDENGVSRPVAFTSRKLRPAERNYPTHEQELLAVVHALKTWRYYLDGTHFIVYTDHATLQHFPTQPKLTRRQARWMELLQEYDFDFRYKPGKDNIVPDALSRRPDHIVDHPPIAVNNMDIILKKGLKQRIIEGYSEDLKLGPIYENCLQGKPPQRYLLYDGLLCVIRRSLTLICIPRRSDIRLSLLHDAHDSCIAGHLGFDKTYDNLRRIVYWPKIAKETRSYIQTCELCQRNKHSLQRPAGLLQPLPIPEQRWDTVTMDFIVGLPVTLLHHDSITVFVDKLSKQVHFVPSKSTNTAKDFAQLFFNNVFRLHGMPRTIVSDRDSKFTSRFWQELTRLMDTKLAMSTAFHPQTDGQSERANQTLEMMLRAFVNQQQNNWDTLLPALEFAYNNSVNPSTGFSPFYLTAGFHPNVPASLLRPTNTVAPSVKEFIESQRVALTLAQEALYDAQERQKRNADKLRRDHDFIVGDQVLINAEDITVPANHNQKSKKLQAQFIGPYTIVQECSPVSFRVELPPTVRIHDVFHVDRFRHYYPSPEALGPRAPPQPTPIIVDGEEEYEVEEILDYRYFRRQHQFLVLWKGFSREKATWERKSQLKNCNELLQKFLTQRGLVSRTNASHGYTSPSKCYSYAASK
jgi:hypothetical protein